MPKRETTKDIKRRAFAAAYVANEGNGTKAMLAIQPSLTEASAAETASKLLKDEKTVSAIDTLYGSVKDHYFRVLDRALALAEENLVGVNPLHQQHAWKFITEIGKLFAQASNTPRSATQINNYRLPPRKTP